MGRGFNFREHALLIYVQLDWLINHVRKLDNESSDELVNEADNHCADLSSTMIITIQHYGFCVDIYCTDYETQIWSHQSAKRQINT